MQLRPQCNFYGLWRTIFKSKITLISVNLHKDAYKMNNFHSLQFSSLKSLQCECTYNSWLCLHITRLWLFGISDDFIALWLWLSYCPTRKIWADLNGRTRILPWNWSILASWGKNLNVFETNHSERESSVDRQGRAVFNERLVNRKFFFLLKRSRRYSSSWSSRVSKLVDIFEKHTIEMIPKSMILFTNGKVD